MKGQMRHVATQWKSSWSKDYDSGPDYGLDHLISIMDPKKTWKLWAKPRGPFDQTYLDGHMEVQTRYK